jgi:hypothetical protein
MTTTIKNIKTGHYTERIFGPDLVLHQAQQHVVVPENGCVEINL